MSREQPVYLTAEGVDELRSELEHLIKVKRPALAERLHFAIQQGDLSENADYTAAKEEQGFLEGRIQQIEAMLLRAVIIEDTGPTDNVALGSHVTVVEVGTDDDHFILKLEIRAFKKPDDVIGNPIRVVFGRVFDGKGFARGKRARL